LKIDDKKEHIFIEKVRAGERSVLPRVSLSNKGLPLSQNAIKCT
jgi:hypothetical protein